ncbi:MAG: NADH oxidase [Rhodospirillaceae bacterium]|nr:MAG: NADH oxidase [Rhodospirillaceae bacterium]
MSNDDLQNFALLSTLTSGGRLLLSVAETPVEMPGTGEILVRVEASPINPSDLLTMLGPADLSTMAVEGLGNRRVLTAAVPQGALAALKGRLDAPFPVGTEGAGTVVRAGPDTQHLLGKKVSVLAGGMYCRYRKVPAAGGITLPDGATAAEGAALLVNPLTALTMVETMRREGHRALVHTAAASNLGQILVRICQADGIDLVNIVRSQVQIDILKGMGARYVVSSESANFRSELAEAIAATGATIAFDAVGGGHLAHHILHAMESVGRRNIKGLTHGSAAKKQVYLYGRLDRSPLELDWNYGTAWSVGVFVMTNVLQDVGPARAAELRDRIVREMKTTFASRYTATIGLSDLLDPQTLTAITKLATGQKYLLDPSRPIGV